MNEMRDNPRWPIPEIILLVLFPMPFIGLDTLQSVFGHMPAWLRLGIIFIVPPFVLLSSALLTFRAMRAKRKWKVALCATCTVAGALATVFATGIVAALGAGPKAFGFVAAGLVGVGGIVCAVKRKTIVVSVICTLVAVIMLGFGLLGPKECWCKRCNTRGMVMFWPVLVAPGLGGGIRSILGPGASWNYCEAKGHEWTVDRSKQGTLHDWKFKRESYDNEKEWRDAVECRDKGEEAKRAGGHV